MRKYTIALLSIFTIVLSLAFGGVNVYAQSDTTGGGFDDRVDTNQAQCFKLTPSGVSQVVCDRNYIDQYNSIAATPLTGCTRGSCLRSNTCYIIAWGASNVPSSSAQCQDWKTNSTDDRGLPVSVTDPTGTDIFGTTREDLQNCRGAGCVNNNPITKIAIYAINVLSGLIAVIVVGVIVMAGIQYSSSGGNPQAAADAKKRIINAIIALIAYFFLFAALQWLIPGGLFRS